jgi:hypothetical protein
MSESEEQVPAPVEVTRAKDIFEARMMAGLLESHGIPVHIPDEETIVLYDGAATIWEKGVRVEVPGNRVEEAIELLAAHREWRARQTFEEE